MKRVFISIPASQELQENILEFKNKFQNLPVRWFASENLHITLVPPRDITDAELLQLVEHLKQVPQTDPFPISFNHVSFGTDFGSPRLIWARGEASAEILQLKQNVEQAINYQPDLVQFTMHITLARFKEKDFPNFPIKTLDETAHWKMLVKEFVIMQSIRMPDGARYPIIQSFPLS